MLHAKRGHYKWTVLQVRETIKQNLIHLVKRHLPLAGRHWWICKFFHSTSGYHQYACNVNQRKLVKLNKHDGLSLKLHHIHNYRNAEAVSTFWSWKCTKKFLKAVSKELWKNTVRPYYTQDCGSSKASPLPHSYVTAESWSIVSFVLLEFSIWDNNKLKCPANA